MKKIIAIALGIAFALIVGVFAITNKPVDVEAVNAESYQMVEQQLIDHGEDPDEFEIHPQITRDGVVEAYIIFDSDGEAVYRCTVNR